MKAAQKGKSLNIDFTSVSSVFKEINYKKNVLLFCKTSIMLAFNSCNGEIQSCILFDITTPTVCKQNLISLMFSLSCWFSDLAVQHRAVSHLRPIVFLLCNNKCTLVSCYSVAAEMTSTFHSIYLQGQRRFAPAFKK